MDSSFFAYLQRLELLAFFSGYPLVYFLVVFLAGTPGLKIKSGSRLVTLLPFAYALAGTLYLGYQLHGLYPDYSIGHIQTTMQQPMLQAWGLLSVVFWIPAFSKKPLYSLIHSLVFFFILLKDLFFPPDKTLAGNDIVRNDMKLYTDSLLLHTGAFLAVLLLSFFLKYYRKSSGT